MTAHAAARCLRLIAQALALGLMIGTAQAAELNPAAVILQLPEQIK
jgi:hypothetical protein